MGYIPAAPTRPRCGAEWIAVDGKTASCGSGTPGRRALVHPRKARPGCVALETSGFAAAMRHWLWLYPIVEIVHILGFVLLIGAQR